MDAVEFFKTVNRICKNKDCNECPVYKNNTCCMIGFDDDSTKSIDETVSKVKQWAKDHPVKTRADKFFELFPDACNFYPADPFPYKKIPDFCPNRFAGNVDNLNCFARNDCVQCKVNFWLAEASE